MNTIRDGDGPKWDEVPWQWRRLLNWELCGLYSTNTFQVIQLKRMKRAGNVAGLGEMICAYRLFVEKPTGKGPHGRPGLRWEENIKMDLQEVGWRDMDWFDLS